MVDTTHPLIPANLKAGPAMKALAKNERHQRFVVNLVMNGGNQADAYRHAGYEPSNANSARVAAHHLAHDERIQAAMREVSQKMMGALSIKAMANLERLLNDPTLEPKDQLKVILAVADRTGQAVKSEHTVKVEHEVTVDIGELKRKAKELAGRLGMAIPAGLIEDAEFTVLEEQPALPAPVTGAEGLEDLLG